MFILSLLNNNYIQQQYFIFTLTFIHYYINHNFENTTAKVTNKS